MIVQPRLGNGRFRTTLATLKFDLANRGTCAMSTPSRFCGLPNFSQQTVSHSRESSVRKCPRGSHLRRERRTHSRRVHLSFPNPNPNPPVKEVRCRRVQDTSALKTVREAT